MTDKTVRRVDTIFKFSMPILTAFAAWVFVQFWETTKELKQEFTSLRVEVVRQNEECRVGLMRQEHLLSTHVIETRKVAQ